MLPFTLAGVVIALYVFMSFDPAGLLIGGRRHTDIPATTFKYLISLLLVFSGYRLLTG